MDKIKADGIMPSTGISVPIQGVVKLWDHTIRLIEDIIQGATNAYSSFVTSLGYGFLVIARVYYP